MPKSRKRKRKRKAKAPAGVRMHPVAKWAFEEQLADFRKKFGRDPVAGEPVFFDPDKDVPTEIESIPDDELIEVFKTMGAEARHLYAYRKTGLMGMEHTLENWPAKERAEWEAAIAEYLRLEGEAGSN